MRPLTSLASTFGVAVAVSNIAQFVWIGGGARALGLQAFGTVLACQAMYGVMQVITDNGSGIHGARQAARGELGEQERAELQSSRILLAFGSALVALAIAGAVAPSLVSPLIPFAVALLGFSVLNVWEPYGRGEARPYASYLILRSLLLAILVVACLVSGLEFSLWFAGLCEVAAVAITGFAFRAWSVPRVWKMPGADTWRAIGNIGGPSLMTQVTFATGTVMLGFAGNPAAAAVAGVGTRLLTGLQAVNGVVAAALFPLIASGEARAAGLAARVVPIGIVALSLSALAVACVLHTSLLELILDYESGSGSDALTLMIGSAAAAGYVMHLTFAVVARGAERGLLAFGVAGFTVTAAATVTAVASTLDSGDTALISAIGFLGGQVLVLWLIAGHLARHDLADWVSRPLVALATGGGLAAAIATVVPAAGAVLAGAGVVVCLWLVRATRSVS